MFKYLREDIQAAKERDPAARSSFEVLVLYQGVAALFWHRRAHFFYRHRMLFIARLISQLSRFFTGIEIHPGAQIGHRCFIDHGMAVVIGETTEIGDDVTIYQGVTLGGTGKDIGKRHPTIGNRVIISTGAQVLGPFSVGDDSKIGAGSVVLEEVPSHSTVVGVPGKVVHRNDHAASEMDVIDLPDPVGDEIGEMRQTINMLIQKLADVEREKNENFVWEDHGAGI